MRYLLPVILILAVLCWAHAAQPGELQNAALERAMKTIRPEAIRAHMRFLASRGLAGRGTGTEGYETAAAYVATEMEVLGLKPAGVNGTWFQPVCLRTYEAVPDQTSFELVHDGKTQVLKFGEDYVTNGSAIHKDASTDASVVFVGYGVTAPELHYDDYANVDVRGKVVVSVNGAPKSFPATERAYFSDGLNKAREAVARGAVGLLTILTPDEQKRWAWGWIAPQIASGGMNWLESDGAPHDAFPQLRVGALLSQRGAEVLFTGAPTSLDQVFMDEKSGKFRSCALPVTAKIHTVSRHAEVQSPNVLGVLPGSDPALRNEYVLYTAHLDHLGICPPVDGDDVCHGAADNASGVAALLEIARAFVNLPQAPRRSVLFGFVTAEEKGLLGSDYFASNPTVPVSAIVANVNLDGVPGLFYSPRDIVAFGAEHSSLGKIVDAAAKRLGYEISPDPMPEEVFFIRSDQYSLVQKGIPAVMIGGGFKTDDPKVNGETIMKNWLTTVYHTPRDNMDQPFRFDAATKGTVLHFLVGYEVAEQRERPTWNKGDFLGMKFAHSQH